MFHRCEHGGFVFFACNEQHEGACTDGDGGGVDHGFSSAPSAFIRTSFKAATHRVPPKPPIQCVAGSEQDQLRILELHAAGELKSGRKNGPATTELKKRLDAQEAERLAQQQSVAGPRKCPEAPKTKTVVVSKSDSRVEKLIIPLEDVDLATGKAPAPDKKARKFVFPPAPAFPSRKEMLHMGPYPLEKAMAALATHAYYLWGDARYLSHVAEGTPSEQLAHTVERFAKKGDAEARRLIRNAHIPVSASPPRLPLAISGIPLMLAFDEGCVRSTDLRIASNAPKSHSAAAAHAFL
eukprot:TRINITY_DN56391_c0_g1_i1.p1 TRINITY_DN56391_c0_g1~~TRINITY_DN56391_c0_g1_i1.p1  ORF type:complete len:295 (-),score=39.70 TRINITY_DN56391_c0_g1_i1:154-1038(-)